MLVNGTAEIEILRNVEGELNCGTVDIFPVSFQFVLYRSQFFTKAGNVQYASRCMHGSFH